MSRGTVTLASTNANDLPLIDPKWLTSTTDQQVAVAAYKRVRQAFSSSFMQKVLIGAEYFPGVKTITDTQILSTIQSTVHTVWHASCTNKMGLASDPMAVVDNNARVFGVTNLRVVDTSAFPLLPPGHPQSTVSKPKYFYYGQILTNNFQVYALAEKIAAQIRSGN